MRSRLPRIHLSFIRRLIGLVAAIVVIAADARSQNQSSTVPATQSKDYYDEMRDEHGQVRIQYRGVIEVIDAKSERSREKFIADSLKAFKGENEIHEYPRLIPASTWQKEIRPGVQQRARAIVAFLKDHYSGEKTYQRFLDPKLVDAIIARTGEAGYAGLISPDSISFFYGPDLIVDASGKWRVIEDNTGFIGGPGDIALVRDFMLRRNPELRNLIDAENPEIFFTALLDQYRKRAAEKGGKVVFLESSMQPDSEDLRMRQIMRRYNVDVIWPDHGLESLVISADGVYTTKKSAEKAGKKSRLEKVGYVVLQGEHAWMDPSHPASFERLMFEEAKSILAKRAGSPRWTEANKSSLRQILEAPRGSNTAQELFALIKKVEPRNQALEIISETRPYQGLTDAIIKGTVGSNYTPGTDFTNDKQFYMTVEELIRFYLHEEPILRNIETASFAGRSEKADEDRLDFVLTHFSDFVIKRVDGRGGDAVWVGAKTPSSILPSLREKILAEPAQFIYQKYTRLSQMGDWIVDSRAIAFVDDPSVVMANTMFGRTTPENGNGKVNVSGGGRELTVFTLRPSHQCRAVFVRSARGTDEQL